MTVHLNALQQVESLRGQVAITENGLIFQTTDKINQLGRNIFLLPKKSFIISLTI